jgi:hypothetical protein
MPNHLPNGLHRYGSHHKALRRRWALVVKAGKAVCWRCGEPIAPNEPWDLGHDDENPARHRGPEHRKCNRGTLPRMLAKARGEAVPAAPTVVPHDCCEEFDPKRCPECRRRDPTPTDPTTRWSRHWSGGVFDPRCPNCRRRGSACDFALKWAREYGGPEAV